PSSPACRWCRWRQPPSDSSATSPSGRVCPPEPDRYWSAPPFSPSASRRPCGKGDLMSHPTSRLDPAIHQPARLGILSAASETKRIDFVSLRELLDLT